MDYKNYFSLIIPERFLPVESVKAMPVTGSDRKYFRIYCSACTLIGALNNNIKENEAFFHFQQILNDHQISVPNILAISQDKKSYILEDLGDNTLFQEVGSHNENKSIDLLKIYKPVIKLLCDVQKIPVDKFDWDSAYPKPEFDRQAIQWDLNYFKYSFLKPMKIEFDEIQLDRDFKRLTDCLLSVDQDFFVLRDFQSRNLMLNYDKVYCIDFQGARKGSRYYDVASLLVEGKIALPEEVRDTLFDYYISESEMDISNRESIKKDYMTFALLRIMQALGAYGFRGLIENKPLFIPSIPYGIKNLENIYGKLSSFLILPEIEKCIQQLKTNREFLQPALSKEKLTITINSFSYRKKSPYDLSGNGGGFVFDCRHINNPGRHPEYVHLTGKDTEVQNFLESKSEMNSFLADVYSIIDRAVDNYKNNYYTHLLVSFGCTGGRHRSVYAAEKLYGHLREQSGIDIRLNHFEQEGFR